MIKMRLYVQIPTHTFKFIIPNFIVFYYKLLFMHVESSLYAWIYNMWARRRALNMEGRWNRKAIKCFILHTFFGTYIIEKLWLSFLPLACSRILLRYKGRTLLWQSSIKCYSYCWLMARIFDIVDVEKILSNWWRDRVFSSSCASFCGSNNRSPLNRISLIKKRFFCQWENFQTFP
jgi:hypothetical protein